MKVPVSCFFCDAMFVGSVGPPRQTLICPHCKRDLSADRTGRWHLFRGHSRFGPYSWRQLVHLADRQQVLYSDVVSCKDAIGELAQAAALLGAEVGTAAGSNSRGPAGVAEHHDAAPSLQLEELVILRMIGVGGMGAVYLGYLQSQECQVAIKVLSARLAATSALARFYREAEVLARLHHPNIVRLIGVGDRAGPPFFVMEYIDGFSTRVLLEHFGGTLPLADALHIILKCAGALDYAHAHGIVHRDIKPQNIMINSLGKVKIADLGLAKEMDEDLSLTESGLMLGSPKYMAPEQAMNAKHADCRSDIYALGGVLYRFLTGRIPFAGSTMMELLDAKRHGSFKPARRLNAEVPPRLSLIIDKMLARRPKDRHQSCAEVIADLQGLGLAGQYLSFNPLQVLPEAGRTLHDGDACHLEFLLIQDNSEDVILVEQALEEKGIRGNLNLVANAAQALAYLRREGEFGLARAPHLIILASNLRAPDMPAFFRYRQASEKLRRIPLVVLVGSEDARQAFEALHVPVTLAVSRPEDLVHFEELVSQLEGVCLTVVDGPHRQVGIQGKK